jgi:hypothetical protein
VGEIGGISNESEATGITVDAISNTPELSSDTQIYEIARHPSLREFDGQAGRPAW